MKQRILVFALVLAAGIPALAAALGNPLAGLEKLKNYEARRASSSDPDWVAGNADYRPLPPHSSFTVAELDGPGVITHIWCTLLHGSPYYSREVTLRIYWDGEEHPSVEAPLGDFFGVGHGLDRAFHSLPVRVTSDGKARNCYWPMPFRKSARIVVDNESEAGCLAFYYYVDWQQHDQLPDDTAYFHARYRQEFPCRMGQNYLLADIRGRGHYVGTVQSVYSASAGWYGEGDDFFFIDGEAEPRLRGTGTEDYFCDAWGFREQDGPFYGTPVWEGEGGAGRRGSAYRWHLPDPIPFKKSLRAEIEHKGSQVFPDNNFTGFIERDDCLSSVAFWYQIEPHHPWPPIPKGPDRLPFREHRLLVGWSALPQSTYSAHPLKADGMFWSTDGKFLRLAATEAGAWLEVKFTIEKELTGELHARLTLGPDFGNYRVQLDGEPVATVKLYRPTAVQEEFKLADRALTAGEHRLRFECVGKAADADAFHLGLDRVTLRVPVYRRPAGADLRKLQAK